MLRSALILAAFLSAMPLVQAQTATRTAEQGINQPRDTEAAASTTTTGSRKDLPFPDMMSAWEYSAQEWQ